MNNFSQHEVIQNILVLCDALEDLEDTRAEVIRALLGSEDKQRLTTNATFNVGGSPHVVSNFFILRNGESCTFFGEIQNGSDENLDSATFTLSFFDEKEQLVGLEDFYVVNWASGQKKSFRVYVSEYEVYSVPTPVLYKIDHDGHL